MSDIDRGADRAGGRVGAVLAIVLIAIAVLIASFTAALALSTPPEENHPAKVAYTSHVTISINGNAQFNNTNFPNNGVVSGTGTASDPYIIEGWDIDASSARGIDIANADAHFTVRYCYVHDGWYSGWNGIVVYNCANGTIEHNDCTDNFEGIFISISHNCTISNNTMSYDEFDCIEVFGSSNCLVENNTCLNAPYYGIEVLLSGELDIRNNNCTGNFIGGISLTQSENCTLSGNVMFYNGIMIAGSNLANWNSHGIDETNEVNGKPVCYIKNQSVFSAPAGVGQVLLANCTDFAVEDLNLSKTSTGVLLGFCSNGTIRNNLLYSDHPNGINLYRSDGNLLENNTCGSCYFAGIKLQDSCGNTLFDNNCSHGFTDGLFIDADSQNNSVVWNQFFENTRYAVCIYSAANYNSILNNSFIANNGADGTFNSSHVQSKDEGTGNRWNSSGTPHGYGNYWADWASPDADADGIVDYQYNITGGGAADYYPLTTPPMPTFIPEFSDIIVPMIGLMLVALVFGRVRRSSPPQPR